MTTLLTHTVAHSTTNDQPPKKILSFLRGWLLVLGLKEGFVECATVCVKSVVILILFAPGLYESFVPFYLKLVWSFYTVKAVLLGLKKDS